MSANATAGTVAGAAAVAVIALAPKVYDRLIGRNHEDADTAAILSSGAGSVASAAIALLATMAEDRDACRADLAEANTRLDDANARIDDLGKRFDALHPGTH